MRVHDEVLASGRRSRPSAAQSIVGLSTSTFGVCPALSVQSSEMPWPSWKTRMVTPGSSPDGMADAALGTVAARLAATAAARVAAAQRRARGGGAVEEFFDTGGFASREPGGATHAGTVVTPLTLGPIRQFVNNF